MDELIETIRENAEHEGDVEAMLKRHYHERMACAGIDTAHLWPGAMGEMVKALKAALARVDYLTRQIKDGTVHWPKDPPEIDNARAILAKLNSKEAT